MGFGWGPSIAVGAIVALLFNISRQLDAIVKLLRERR